MKSCPTCKRTFDDNFTFCLVDGSILDVPFEANATLVISEPRQTEPPPTELPAKESAEAVPPTISSPAQIVSAADKKPSEFSKAPSDSLNNSISLSRLGLAPAAGESSR